VELTILQTILKEDFNFTMGLPVLKCIFIPESPVEDTGEWKQLLICTHKSKRE